MDCYAQLFQNRIHLTGFDTACFGVKYEVRTSDESTGSYDFRCFERQNIGDACLRAAIIAVDPRRGARPALCKRMLLVHSTVLWEIFTCGEYDPSQEV